MLKNVVNKNLKLPSMIVELTTFPSRVQNLVKIGLKNCQRNCSQPICSQTHRWKNQLGSLFSALDRQ